MESGKGGLGRGWGLRWGSGKTSDRFYKVWTLNWSKRETMRKEKDLHCSSKALHNNDKPTNTTKLSYTA